MKAKLKFTIHLQEDEDGKFKAVSPIETDLMPILLTQKLLESINKGVEEYNLENKQ